jgi:integrase
MKPTDFSVHVTTFLTHYLAAQRNVSPNTIKAYRDVFTLLLRFCRDVKGIAPERLRLEQLDVSLVEAFLDYLERERHSAPRTRNHRLAALHAFFRYVQSEEPDRMLQCQKILAIPQRRHARATVGYLSKEDLAEILAQPDLTNPGGPKRCGFAKYPLRYRSASSGVNRSFGRRRTIGSTRAGAPSGKGTQDARCTFDGEHGPAPTRSYARKPFGSSRTV